jgi:hypothetical protein
MKNNCGNFKPLLNLLKVSEELNIDSNDRKRRKKDELLRKLRKISEGNKTVMVLFQSIVIINNFWRGYM